MLSLYTNTCRLTAEVYSYKSFSSTLKNFNVKERKKKLRLTLYYCLLSIEDKTKIALHHFIWKEKMGEEVANFPDDDNNNDNGDGC